MRATIVTSLATLVLTCSVLTYSASACLAQTASPDKSDAPQPLTGEGGTDKRGPDVGASNVLKDYPVAPPSKSAGPAKGGRAAGRDEAGRVGTLSPDEERRAARARARATRATEVKPSPAHDAVPAEEHAADLRRPLHREPEHRQVSMPMHREPARREASAPVRPGAAAVKMKPPAQDHAEATMTASTDRPRRLFLANRRRIAAVATVRRAYLQAKARAAARVLAGDIGRPARLDDEPAPVRFAPPPPQYGNVADPYERRLVADWRPHYVGVFGPPRGLFPYPPQAGWYSPLPPYGYPFPRYGF